VTGIMSTNLRIFTTEYTEFHGGKERYRIKTPWYSVTSVVIFLIKLAHMVTSIRLLEQRHLSGKKIFKTAAVTPYNYA
jgi:hypothetical protein